MIRASGRGALSLVLGHAALVQVITYAMRPTISYTVLDAGASPVLLGVISAAFALPALLLALPAGHALDRIGERSALILGPLALVAAALLAIFAGPSVGLLIFATVLLGIGHLLSVVGQQAMVANTTDRGRFDSAFGFYGFAASFGQTLGPLLLVLPGGTVSTPPTQLIFLCCGIISAVMLLLSAFMKSSVREPVVNRPSMLRTAKMLLKSPGLPRALVATSIVLSSVDIFLAYAPALGQDRGLSAAVVSAMLVARSMFSMVSRLFLGPMVRIVGRRRLLMWTITLAAVMLGCIAFPVPVFWLIVLAGAFGFVVGTCQPITMSWISELSPPGTRGLAMSMRLASNRLGQTVLPAALGAFAAATGAAGVLVATGVVLIGAAWSSGAVANVGDDEDNDGSMGIGGVEPLDPGIP